MPHFPYVRFFHDGFGVYDGLFPLYVATEKMNELMIMVLTQVGEADVNQTTAMGETALHRAAQCLDDNMFPAFAHVTTDSTAMRVLKQIIELGADVNQQDSFGMTPLHHACNHYSPNMVEILLDSGADASIEDFKNRTPLVHAALRGYKVTNVILQKSPHISRQARIEAYELMALEKEAPDNYKALLKATRLRRKYGIPKRVLPALECYDNIKEFETFEELRAIENNEELINLHGILARERILKGIGFDLFQDLPRDGMLSFPFIVLICLIAS